LQNRYVGDIGDFGKYGMLRALCGPSSQPDRRNLRLGVVWMLVEDEDHNNDGGHTAYLAPSVRNRDTFRTCDPELFDLLSWIVCKGERRVSAIAKYGVLPQRTIFYQAPLDFSDPNKAERVTTELSLQRRQQWLNDALNATDKADVVFFDPDNGLEVNVGRHQAKGRKYLFIDEVAHFFARGQSLVIYQHLDRTRPGHEQMAVRLGQLQRGIPGIGVTWGLLFRRGTARAFLVVPQSSHRAVLEARSQAFVATGWRGHFEVYPPLVLRS
jgi:hypothetical protein